MADQLADKTVGGTAYITDVAVSASLTQISIAEIPQRKDVIPYWHQKRTPGKATGKK